MLTDAFSGLSQYHGLLYLSLYFVSCIVFTLVLFRIAGPHMPVDQGRAFAVNGELSRGKLRGVGLLFILGYIAATLLFVPWRPILGILLALLLLTMLTGYFDDASTIPWGGLKKGLLDLAISFAGGYFAYRYIGSECFLAESISFTVPAWLYVLLAAGLIWGSINVVNCTDGVDGLCTSVSIVSISAFALLDRFSMRSIIIGDHSLISILSVGMILCLVPYLWYNAKPSSMLMGDAGSRALGFFLAMLALLSRNPLSYLILCIVFIFDGGLGLLKLALLRSVRVHILKSVRTPLHDHCRKNLNWSDTQVVIRFVLLQLALAIIYIFVLRILITL